MDGCRGALYQNLIVHPSMVEAFAMSDISPVSGSYTGRVDPTVDRPGRPAAATLDERPTSRPSDRVDISDRARYLSKLAALPDVRTELVDRIRSEIAGGT